MLCHIWHSKSHPAFCSYWKLHQLLASVGRRTSGGRVAKALYVYIRRFHNKYSHLGGLINARLKHSRFVFELWRVAPRMVHSCTNSCVICTDVIGCWDINFDRISPEADRTLDRAVISSQYTASRSPCIPTISVLRLMHIIIHLWFVGLECPALLSSRYSSACAWPNSECTR